MFGLILRKFPVMLLSRGEVWSGWKSISMSLVLLIILIIIASYVEEFKINLFLYALPLGLLTAYPPYKFLVKNLA